MLLASAVVVWEWLNEHGRWRPYSPAVSHQIEAAIRNSDPRGGSVVLGQVDNRLSPYIIDLQSMHQFRQDTGMSGAWSWLMECDNLGECILPSFPSFLIVGRS
uniref:WWE domain-containing protein n=1 Tax=Oryzias sinensis TaxID=183150 RepID=A0A8C7YSQ4_9TELE